MYQNLKLSEQRVVSGNYFFDFGSCTTRLWLSNKRIDVGLDNSHIQIGKYIDEKTKPRLRKRLTIQGLCSIDYIEENTAIEIHEIKKGKSKSFPHYLQLLFYLQVIFEITGQEPTGYLHLPQARKVVKIERNEVEIYRTYYSILDILDKECPKPSKKPICSGCRFAEMCWA